MKDNRDPEKLGNMLLLELQRQREHRPYVSITDVYDDSEWIVPDYDRSEGSRTLLPLSSGPSGEGEVGSP